MCALIVCLQVLEGIDSGGGQRLAKELWATPEVCVLVLGEIPPCEVTHCVCTAYLTGRGVRR